MRVSSIFVVFLCASVVRADENAESIVDKVIANRMSITSGSAAINIDTSHVIDDYTRNINYKLKVWFDEQHRREDKLERAEKQTSFIAGYERILCLNCESPGHLISAVRGPVEATFKKMATTDVYLKVTLVDLRFLGIYAVHYPNHGTTNENIAGELKKRLMSPDSHKYTVTKSGQLYTVESFFRFTGARQQIVIDASKNYLVTSIVRDLNAEGKHIECAFIMSGINEVAPGIWYASVINHVQKENGKQTLCEQYTISDLVINKPIPPNIFTLAGIGLADGTSISTPDEHGQDMKIKGGKIVNASVFRRDNSPGVSVAQPSPEPVAVPASTVSTSSRWPYALGAGVFAIVTVFFLRRLIISRTG